LVLELLDLRQSGLPESRAGDVFMQALSKLISFLCVALTALFLYVFFFLEPTPKRETPCSPQAVMPGDAEKYGFKHGDADVPEAYKAELRRRCREGK
jgi:hypothetical protein